MKKTVLFVVYLIVLAGTVSILVDYLADYIKPKKEIKKVPRDYSADLAINMDVVMKRINDGSIYLDLDPVYPIKKIIKSKVSPPKKENVNMKYVPTYRRVEPILSETLSFQDDNESLDLTKAELKEQKRLDSLASVNQSGIDKNISDEENFYFIRAFFLALVFSAIALMINEWSYRFDYKTLTKEMP